MKAIKNKKYNVLNWILYIEHYALYIECNIQGEILNKGTV